MAEATGLSQNGRFTHLARFGLQPHRRETFKLSANLFFVEKRIRRGCFHSAKTLEQAIMEHLEDHNQHPKPFAWTAPLTKF